MLVNPAEMNPVRLQKKQMTENERDILGTLLVVTLVGLVFWWAYPRLQALNHPVPAAKVERR